jgi:hypothetical protein
MASSRVEVVGSISETKPGGGLFNFPPSWKIPPDGDFRETVAAPAGV